jgi:hypothetical protein
LICEVLLNEFVKFYIFELFGFYMAVSMFSVGLMVVGLVALVVGWKVGSFILKVVSLLLIVGALAAFFWLRFVF